MTGSTKHILSYLDMILVVQLVDQVGTEGLNKPYFFKDFSFDPLNMALDEQVKKYRKAWSPCTEAAFTFTDSRKEVLCEYLKAYYRGVRIQLKRNSSESCAGGSLN